VSIGQIIGLTLVIIGLAEFLIFRHLAKTKPNIARRKTLLYVNAGFNVVLGALLIAIL
jgi:hypothetical protein